jgi:general secretion pathway protein F
MPSFPPGEFAEFNALLASAAERGLPLEPVLALLAGQAGTPRLRSALEAVRRGLKDGKPLPEALREVPEFPNGYVALVEAGHSSGRLPEVLGQASAYYSLLSRVRQRFGRLLLYLAFGALAAVLLFAGAGFFAHQLNTGIDFRDLFGSGWEDFGPMWMSTHPGQFIVYSVGGLGILGGVVFLVLALMSKGRMGYWIPLWGSVLRSRDLSLFCAVAGLRLSAGAGTLEAFRSARDAVPNRHARRLVDRAIRKLEEGATPSDALFYVRWFPRVLAWNVSLGEKRGELPKALASSARIHGAQMERGFEMLLVALGPVGILVLGNVCLVAAMAALAPFVLLFRVMQSLS